MRSLLLIGLGALGAFAGEVADPSPSTAYYYGSVKFFSDDGNTSRGESVSLIKREIRPAEGKIVESVLQPPRKPGDKPREIVATMTRVPNTTEFDATDPEHSFSGKQIFEGEGWVLPRWSYDIRLESGGRITGRGSLDSKGIKTKKLIYDSDGKPALLMEEDLGSISSDEYTSRRERMLAQ